ncbi:hypothetical protein [uncultured Paraglaciecola sp.]|uniref:hypothetical protein n=1 Tax=uncultured Paraglaciecola sp. TaxID=1765024 RepID=UPI002622BAD7|nr:hypothetical protein [uncultured Paraglaciecola sp.]
MTKLKTYALAIVAMALCTVTQAQTSNMTLQFVIAEVTDCAPLPNSVCLPVTEYRVYAQGSTVPLATSPSTDATVSPFAVTLGQEYCFEATAFNGAESARSPASCHTWNSAPPSGTVIIELNAIVVAP